MSRRRPSNTDILELTRATDSYIAKLQSRQRLSEIHIDNLVALYNRYGLSNIPEIIEYLDAQIAKIRKPHEDALDLCINWLRPESDPNSFINIDHFVSDKNRGRFKDFNVHTLVYKRTRTWDWQPITVGVLVPKGVDKTKPVPVHVQWHGGGFITGDWNFEPFFAAHLLRQAKANNSVIVAPNYRLMPEASGKDILEDVEDFWQWFAGPEFTDGIKEVEPGLKLQRKQLLVSGDSAGAFLAVYSWLKCSGPELPMQALFLRYPMLRYYGRTWPDTDGPKGKKDELMYMDNWIQRSTVEEKAEALLAKIKELENIGQCPTVTGGTMPLRMLASFTLSTAGRWKENFQRDNATLDILDMINDTSATRLEPTHFPPIFIYHGHDDINCLIEDTRTFVKDCERRWPGQYKPGSRIHLEVVSELVDKDGGDGFSTQVGHGFDSNLHEDKEPFLKRTLEGVRREWGVTQK
ncbi:alpha/beta-hydrolase [Massarina eburnea CBS 473.64]|uniref:Alpha/beta-hydrolase n=1 Tax=Massarina eburnea CBS 473.64 TaxID=1395130 RepID=A0A6A6RMD5_9PLEO|nr:alpha/beta-hydrolase [Massarina eburnea CBS 473.64]